MVNQFIQNIETIGADYGLKLNKTKCELLTTEKEPNIHFADNTKVTKKDEVKYLGCQINQQGDTRNEIGKRIANAWNTLQKLQICWKRSNCPITFKIIALDAIVRSKLIYGTDAMQLNEPELKRMEKSTYNDEKTAKLGHNIHKQRKHQRKNIFRNKQKAQGNHRQR